MRIKPLIIGFTIILLSIPGYQDTPILIPQMVHTFMGSFSGSSGGGSSSLLHQMGYPSKSTVISALQASFLGLIILGAAFVLFGAVAKKIKKQVTVKLVTEQPGQVHAAHVESEPKYQKTQTNPRSLAILQDRLASGEITSNEFQRLKTLLEQSYQANS